jgi:hypothetical protein
MRILLIIASALVLGLLGLIGLLYGWAHWPFNWPSDNASIALFRDHRAEFVRIVDMVREDQARRYIPRQSLRINPRWGRPNLADSQTKKMPVERFDEYAKAFNKLGLRYGLTLGNESEVDFNIACIGTLAIGPCSYKGIVYRPEAKWATTVGSLESNQLPNVNGTVAPGYYLRLIEGDWWIYRKEFD